MCANPRDNSIWEIYRCPSRHDEVWKTSRSNFHLWNVSISWEDSVLTSSEKLRISDSDLLWCRASLEDYFYENKMPYGIEGWHKVKMSCIKYHLCKLDYKHWKLTQNLTSRARYKRYQSLWAFQEQNFCHPKTEKTEIYLTTLEHRLLGGPIRLLALISIWSLTNQIVCFAHTL